MTLQIAPHDYGDFDEPLRQSPKFLENLNEAQKEAVTLPFGHALILAGAGSGKTRVLTTRIAWLLRTQGLSPAAVLAVTFTNKAAREMMARLSSMLNFDMRRMWVGTFHGLCHRLLRIHHQEAELPAAFQILDQSDQYALIRRMFKSQAMDEKNYPPKDVQHFINAQKEAGLRPHEVEAVDGFTRRKVEFYRLYDALCRQGGLVDFAELLLRSYELLKGNAALHTHYQERFSHILVDEFQDTNPLQYRWLRLLTGKHSCLFCVGDDDQSIYAFRGAHVGNMNDFKQDYGGHLIRLEQNYRSSGAILDAANALIRNNPGRLGKNLWTESGQGEPLRVFEAMADTEEAHWLVEEVKRLADAGTSLNRIAVLYRSNAQSRIVEHNLFSAAVPYRVYGGQRFFDRQEIKHALAYLRLLSNPRDDTSFLRVVNFPTRGIGNRSLEILQDLAQRLNVSLFEAVEKLSQTDARAASAVEKFIHLLDAMKAACVGQPLPQMVAKMLEMSGLRAYYQGEKGQDKQERLENLDEMVNAAKNFISEEEDDLAAFLSHAALEAGERQAGSGEEALQLMTIHAAKGLEFEVVFICGLEEGLFPHEQALFARNGLEEERRLMYVALTRAEKRLYLSLAKTRMLRGQTRYGLHSRFLEELPKPLLKWLTPPPQKTQTTNTPHFATASSYPAPQPSAPRFSNTPWRAGQKVRHHRFGSGVILTTRGSGEELVAHIRFEQEGEKYIALAMGKLEVIS